MAIGQITRMNPSGRFGFIAVQGGGEIRFEERDLASGVEFDGLKQRCNRVSFLESMRDSSEPMRTRHYAANVSPVE